MELGFVRQRQGRHRLAALLLRYGLRIKRALDEPYGEAEALSRLGAALLGLGRTDEAEAAQREALDIVAESGNTSAECMLLNNLADTLTATGRPAEAAPLYRRAQERAATMGDRPELARAHAGLGDVAATEGAGSAYQHWTTAHTLFADMSMPEQHALAARMAAETSAPAADRLVAEIDATRAAA